MMDRLTVMGCLEGLTQDDWERWYSDSEAQETAKAALSMLKEQEAKLVLNIADSIAGMEVGDCPRCGRYLANRISDPSKFCKYCGQAVKWDE